MKPYDTVAVTNQFGQVIQPGQSCVIVAKGYSGGISTYKGRYLGVRTYRKWSDKNEQQVVAEVEDRRFCYLLPDGTELKNPYNDPRRPEAKPTWVPCKRITNLWLNLIYPTEF